MASIILPRKWTSQPQSRVSISQEYLDKQIVIAHPYGSGYDAARNIDWSVTGTVSRSTITDGIAGKLISSSYLQKTTVNPSAYPFTVAITAEVPVVGSVLIGYFGESGSQRGYYLSREASGDLCIVASSGSDWILGTIAASANLIGTIRVLGTFRSATDRSGYAIINGKRYAVTSTTSRSLSTLGNGLIIGTYMGATAPVIFNTNSFANVMVAHSAFSEAEAFEYLSNPQAIFKRSPQVLYFDTAAGGATYTISPTGSIAFSNTSKLVFGKQISPTGSIVFSNTVSFVKEKVIYPTGSIVYSGTAPLSTEVSYTISPTGSIVFNGTVLPIHEKIVVPIGTLVFSGSANISAEASYTISPTGDITFSGTNNFLYGKTLIPTGTVVFSGTASITSNTSAPQTITTRLPLTGIGT